MYNEVTFNLKTKKRNIIPAEFCRKCSKKLHRGCPEIIVDLKICILFANSQLIGSSLLFASKSDSMNK